jgi:hypothetical protein
MLRHNNIFTPLMSTGSAVRHYLSISLALILTYCCQQTSGVKLMYSTDIVVQRDIYYLMFVDRAS